MNCFGLQGSDSTMTLMQFQGNFKKAMLPCKGRGNDDASVVLAEQMLCSSSLSASTMTQIQRRVVITVPHNRLQQRLDAFQCLL